MGIPSDRQFLGLVGKVLPGCFPHLPEQSQYNRRLRRLAPTLAAVQLRVSELIASGDLRIADGTHRLPRSRARSSAWSKGSPPLARWSSRPWTRRPRASVASGAYGCSSTVRADARWGSRSFDSEDDLRRGDDALNALSPPAEGAAKRTGVDFYEVAFERQMALPVR
jgi:hypothetical protein